MIARSSVRRILSSEKKILDTQVINDVINDVNRSRANNKRQTSLSSSNYHKNEGPWVGSVILFHERLQ